MQAMTISTARDVVARTRRLDPSMVINREIL